MKTQHVALGPTTFTHSGKVSSYRRLCVAAQEHKGLTVGDLLSNSCVQAQGAGRPPMVSKRLTHERHHPLDSPLCLAAPFPSPDSVPSLQEQNFRQNPICLNISGVLARLMQRVSVNG